MQFKSSWMYTVSLDEWLQMFRKMAVQYHSFTMKKGALQSF